MEILRLIPSLGNNVELQLHREKSIYTLEAILSSDKRVYEDITYEFEMVDAPEYNELSVYFNGEAMDFSVQGTNFVVNSETHNQAVFGGRIGFLQISLCFETNIGEKIWYYSEYVSILVKSTRDNQAINTMLDYVYENQRDLLYQGVGSVLIGKNYQQSYDDFWSQILLLEEIMKVYENQFGYFKANCRTKLEECEVVDRTDKLQYVDARTIRYIVQHPEYLKNDVRGIELGHQKFLPTKTLMIQNKNTYDIYENQVVVSFLKRICNEVAELRGKVEQFIDNIAIGFNSENDYIVSSQIIYKNAYDSLSEFFERLKIIEDKVEYLYVSYRGILDVTEQDLINIPKPTAIFMSIPQYNQIYICIHRWFSKTGYDFIKERYMLGFFDAPSIYEAYVLTKLLGMIKDYGYELQEAKKVTYHLGSNVRFQQKDCNNTFKFVDGNNTVILYYEPVIYDHDTRNINGIGLYRNNSVGFRQDSEQETIGSCYTPDYLIKLVVKGMEKYIILDAKYKYFSNVRHKDVPVLSYKYLFSIDPVDSNCSVEGLGLIYGKHNNITSVASFFDREIPGTRDKSPFVRLIPLTENMSYENQRRNVFDLLQYLSDNI